MGTAASLGGFVVSMFIALLSLFAGYVASARWPSVPGLTVAGLLILGVEVVFRSREASQERVFLRLLLASTGVFGGLLAVAPLTHPFDAYTSLHDGEFLWACAFYLPFVMAVFGVLALLFTTRVAAGDRALAALRWVAVAATVGVGLLVVAALPRAARRATPPTSCGQLFDWVATVPPSERAGTSDHDASRAIETAGARVSARCDAQGICSAWLGADRRHGEPLWLEEADFITVRHDAASDRWLLSSQGNPGRCAMYQGPEMTRIHLRPTDLAASFGPPKGWIVGAALGVLVALVALARGTRVRRALALVAGMARGRVDADGWLRLAEGNDEPLRVQGVAAGPVLVRFAAPRRGPAYRSGDERRIESIRPGKRRPVLRAMRLQVAFHDALALGAVVLLGAPVVVAALLGFVV